MFLAQLLLPQSHQISASATDAEPEHPLMQCNQIPISESAAQLGLLLSACNNRDLLSAVKLETFEVLHLLVLYLCFAHQWALTVTADSKGRSCLKMHHQGGSATVPTEGTTKHTLMRLRSVYCQGLDGTQQAAIFPEAHMLVDNQRLWGLFRIPTSSPSTSNCFQSLIALLQPKAEVTKDQWFIGVGAYSFRRSYGGHAFLLIEGMDEYGRGLFLRYDLARDQSSKTARYHVTKSPPIVELQTETDRAHALRSMLNNKDSEFVSCSASRENEVATLIKAVEAEVGKDMTTVYSSLPVTLSGSQTLRGSKQSEPKINCLTWIIKHLKIALGDEKFRKEFAELEQGLPIPTQRVRRAQAANESKCVLM